jgi:hypothetical protein
MLSSTHHSERVLLPRCTLVLGYKWIHVTMNGGRATGSLAAWTAKSGMVTNGQVEFEYCIGHCLDDEVIYRSRVRSS